MSSNTTTLSVTNNGSLSGARMFEKNAFATNCFFIFLLVVLALFQFGDAALLTEKSPELSKKCLSKFYLLREVDRWQNRGSDLPFRLSDDPSAALEHIPNELYSQNNGAVAAPLWNDLSGAGRPFAGEFQTLNWSSYRRWFPFSDWQLYNLGIFIRLLLAGIACYFVSRRLGNSGLSSFVAGTAFMLCPRLLRWVELCNNYFAFPVLLLCFLWVGSKPSILRAVLCSAIVAAFAYETHPETFACAVVAGSIISLDDYFRNSFKRQRSFFAAIADWFRWQSLIAILSLLLTAPLILPFLEFVRNSASYKFDTDVVAFIPWADYIANMVLPLGTMHYYLGAVLGLLIFPGLAKFFRERKTLALSFFAAALFCVRPGIFETLFSHKPFIFVLPEYPLGTLALLQACIAAAGLDSLANNRKLASRFKPNWWVLVPCSIGLLVVLGQIPAIAELAARFSDAFAYESSSVPVSLRVLAATTCVLVALFFSMRLSKKGSAVCSLILLVLNSLSLLHAAALEFTPGPGASYRPVDELELAQNIDSRIVATGFSTFQPNTNLLYNINDFCAYAPIHPTRFMEFCTAAGVGTKYCFLQNCPDTLGPLFDLASVKYILSDRAISRRGAEEDGSAGQAQRAVDAKAISVISGPIKLGDGLRYQNAIVSYSPSENALSLTLEFFFDPSMQARYISRPVLTDDKGTTIYAGKWNSESIDKDATPLLNHKYVQKMSLPLPHNFPAGKVVNVDLIVKDTWTDAPLKISGEHCANTSLGNALRIGSFTSQLPQAANSPVNGLKRISDTADGFFLYENQLALPRAYLVHNSITVKNSEASLAALKRNVDWHNFAVIEDPHSDEEMRNKVDDDLRKSDELKILDRDSDSILLKVRSKAPAFLILTDTFFPGWVAQLDGKDQEIYPANHAFRAVKVPAGAHYVKFSYEPESFRLGLTLFKGGACISLVLLVVGLVSELRKLQLRKNKENSGTAAESKLP